MYVHVLYSAMFCKTFWYVHVSSILTSGIPSVNKTYLQASTLVGPTVTRLVQDPLAVLTLENQLYIHPIA